MTGRCGDLGYLLVAIFQCLEHCLVQRKRRIQLLHNGRTAEDAPLLPLVSHFILHIYMASVFLLQAKEHGILETLLLDHSFLHSPQLGFKFVDGRLPFLYVQK